VVYENPKKGRRLPLPKKAGGPIGTRKGKKGYDRRVPLEEAGETVEDFAYVRPQYELLEHTADLGVRVRGESLGDLFENAGLMLFDLLVDLAPVRPRSKWKVSVAAQDPETLFVQWLRELLNAFYVKKRIFCRLEIAKINEKSLAASCWGEVFNRKRHTVLTEIKAATYHDLSVKREDSGWVAEVIFDV